MTRYKPYKKDSDFFYTFGIYPCIELLKYTPEHAIEVLLDENWEQSSGCKDLVSLCIKHHIPYRVDRKTISSLGKQDSLHAIIIGKKYQMQLSTDTNHLLLHEPSDMGNLGTILRTMCAYRYLDLAIISPGVDAFHPKTIRASMGAIFQINIEYFESIESYLSKFKSRKLYLFMLQSSTDFEKIDLEIPHTLAFGSEGAGLPNTFSKYGTPVKLMQSDKVDSLNLSVAVGIGLYISSRHSNTKK